MLHADFAGAVCTEIYIQILSGYFSSFLWGFRLSTIGESPGRAGGFLQRVNE